MTDQPKNPNPRKLYEQTAKQRADLLRECADLQTGPNPLTREEVRKLYAKRPEVYDFLCNW